MVLFRALLLLLMGGMSFANVQNFIEVFLGAARNVLFGTSAGTIGLLHSELFTIFAVIAVGFLTITFYSELIKEATNDTLTTDKFVAAICKLFVGAMMIFFLPEILNIIFNLVEVMFKAASSVQNVLNTNANAGITGLEIKIAHKFHDTDKLATLKFPISGITENKDIGNIYNDTKSWWMGKAQTMVGSKAWTLNGAIPDQSFGEYWDDYYGGLMAIDDIGQWILAVVIIIVSLVAVWGSYFAIAKAVIEFVIFSFLAPVGIINVMSENNRLVGVKYLKKLLAKGLTLAVMIVLITVCSNLCGGMIVSALKSAGTGLSQIAYEVDDNGNIVGTTELLDPIVDSNGYLSIEITKSSSQLDDIFEFGTIGRCLIMQIAQVGLLLGAAKLSDELFAS